jgi:preprotein translocase subunit SecF
MMDFVGKKRWFFLVSWILVVIGVVSLVASQIGTGSPLQLGIDFKGGTSMILAFGSEVEQSQLQEEMSGLGYDEARIQDAGEGSFIVYTREITYAEAEELVATLGVGLDSEVEIVDYYYVSEVVASKTARNAFIAVVVAAVAMLFYIVWAFRRMPKPFRWGSCAVIALIHNVFIILGVFSLLGLVAGVAIDALFITGLLAVVGYSINNTVVVFDRIRENKARGISSDFASTVNSSIIETLGRCLNTALTTLFVLLALFLFGGATIYYFVLVLLLGVVIGTYDSLCFTGQFLVVWETGDWGSLLPWVKTRA